MSLLDLALPRDITWNLIATSDDMLATHANRFPNAAWRSSLAVFAYVPDLSDLPEDFPDRALTFLKVVCSITSYSPGCQALPPAPTPPEATGYIGTDMLNQRGYQDALSVWRARVEELKRLEQSTFPCSGALVQVAVYPKDGDTTDVDQLAYFASFEPQKRDLVEAVTESGEALTQSKSALQVRKGVTATDSMEDLDVFMGANVNAGFGGAQVGVGVSGQWGTIKKSGTESVDITNTDTSREAREQASHTTSLSQLYHLLDSYHLGTNRAEFFLQSRPHTVQQKDRFTFIDGPQDIEGIQEFFLVVSHPKDKVIVPTQDKPTADYCVDALLYTGHLDTYKLQASLTEPKTAESPWQELWLGYETPKKEGDDFQRRGRSPGQQAVHVDHRRVATTGRERP